jgi:hypothetical protein
MKSFITCTVLSPLSCSSTKHRWKKGVGHVAYTEEKINIYELLTGKPEGKKILESARWEDNINGS